MRRLTSKWFLALVTAAALGLGGWGVSRALAQNEKMAGDDMKMMKQMMDTAPSAMKRCQKSIMDQKQNAIKQGKYTCCLRHPCDFCAEHMGQCPCGKNAAADKPVCNECKGSWYAGDGAVPNKTPEQIKTLPRPLPGMGM
jgi:hypothetical protein